MASTPISLLELLQKGHDGLPVSEAEGLSQLATMVLLALHSAHLPCTASLPLQSSPCRAPLSLQSSPCRAPLPSTIPSSALVLRAQPRRDVHHLWSGKDLSTQRGEQTLPAEPQVRTCRGGRESLTCTATAQPVTPI